MNIELKYFTGTGNSLKVIKTCASVFSGSGNNVKISEISTDETTVPESDLTGFCFPVYAFGIPRICRQYLQGLEKFKNLQKVFVLITAGDIDESGYATQECEKILSKKNCEIIYTDVIQMPVNWTTSPKPPFPPSKEEALEIIVEGVAKTQNIAEEILEGVKRKHSFNYPKRYSKIKFHWDYLIFKHLGIKHMWRLFNVYDTCNGCRLCSKICPTNSISMIGKKPIWNSTCEQCMRCVNFCPNESIYQTQGGETKGRNRYYEPGFNPRHNDHK